MSGSYVSIKTADGEFSAYASRPGLNGRGAGVVVIQEIFGVNTVMRAVCDQLAAEGFVAICPDLFWRIEPGLQLTDASDEEWARAFELYKAFDVDHGVTDIAAAIDYLRTGDLSSGKVGAVGYCLGGLLAYLTAARTSVDAAVGYYGVGIQDRLEEAARIRAPLMLHIAGQDQFVPTEAQARIEAGLSERAGVTLYRYPTMDHAFARTGGKHYDAEQAELANTRTTAFFKAHLG